MNNVRLETELPMKPSEPINPSDYLTLAEAQASAIQCFGCNKPIGTLSRWVADGLLPPAVLIVYTGRRQGRYGLHPTHIVEYIAAVAIMLDAGYGLKQIRWAQEACKDIIYAPDALALLLAGRSKEAECLAWWIHAIEKARAGYRCQEPTIAIFEFLNRRLSRVMVERSDRPSCARDKQGKVVEALRDEIWLCDLILTASGTPSLYLIRDDAWPIVGSTFTHLARRQMRWFKKRRLRLHLDEPWMPLPFPTWE